MCLFSGLLFGRTAAKKAAQWEWTHGLTHLLNPKSTNARPRAFLLACVHRYSSKWKLLTTQFSFDGHSLMRAMFLSSNCQSIPPVGCCYHWQISKCAYCSSFSLDYENGGGFVFLSCMMMWCFAKGADKHFIRKCIPISALAAGSPSPGGGLPLSSTIWVLKQFLFLLNVFFYPQAGCNIGKSAALPSLMACIIWHTRHQRLHLFSVNLCTGV